MQERVKSSSALEHQPAMQVTENMLLLLIDKSESQDTNKIHDVMLSNNTKQKFHET